MSLVLTSAEVATLGDGGLVVRDGVWGPLADAVRDAAVAWRQQGALTAAGVGLAGERLGVRDDRTAFLEPEPGEAPWDAVWRWAETAQGPLSSALWLGLQRFSVQVACYPGDGARYLRHVDALRAEAARRVTAIVYLNPGWTPEDGGCLRAYTPAGPVDVAPVHDRLVLFLADRVPHEVLPTNAVRYAVTTWFRGPQPVPWVPDP